MVQIDAGKIHGVRNFSPKSLLFCSSTTGEKIQFSLVVSLSARRYIEHKKLRSGATVVFGKFREAAHQPDFYSEFGCRWRGPLCLKLIPVIMIGLKRGPEEADPYKDDQADRRNVYFFFQGLRSLGIAVVVWRLL